MNEVLILPIDEAEHLHRNAAQLAKIRRFEIINIDNIDVGKEPPWLIDRLMPATGLAVVYGLPKSGKSFLIADAVLHVAMGHPWAGRETLSGSVAYCAGEGVSGFKRRLVAFREHYGVEGKGLPFGLIPVAPNLGREGGDDQRIIATLKDWLKNHPPLRAIVIDTLSRSMRGADENTARDMGVFVDNCERIGREFGCVVIVVHHAGKEAERGARGSIALPAAADVMWYVERGEASNQATIVAMKDGEDGISWRFRLLPFEGAQQSAANSCVVEILTEPEPAQQPAAKRSKKLNDGQRMLLDILRSEITEAGTQVKGDFSVPHNVSAILRSTLKKYLKLRGYWDDDLPDNRNRSNLSRDLKALATKKIIGLTSEYVWLIEKD
jgi:hypothetical protein